MNTIKFQALGYLGIGVSLIKLSLPASGWRESFLLTVGIVFMLVALLFSCSLKLSSRRLIKVTEQIQQIRVSHLSVLSMLLPLAVALIQRQEIILTILVLCSAYICFGLVVGNELAEVLLSLLNRMKRRKALHS